MLIGYLIKGLGLLVKGIFYSWVWLPIAWFALGGHYIPLWAWGVSAMERGASSSIPLPYQWVFLVVLGLTLLFMVWAWIRGAVRFIKKDPQWSLLGMLSDRKAAKPAENKAANNTKAGKPTGVVFGKASRGGGWVCRKENGQDHILVFGAPGLGKSQSIVIPSLHCWNGGKFIIDIKGELYDNRPAGAADMVSLAGDSELGYDPFTLIDDLSQDLHDTCRDIALTLVPPNPKESDPYWTEAAQNLLSSALITGKGEGLSFLECMEAITALGASGLVDWLTEVRDYRASAYTSQFIDMERGKQLASVYSTVINKIAVFTVDESIRSMLSKPIGCNINPMMLLAGTSIYVCIPEHKIEQYKNVISLIVNQTLRFCMTFENNNPKRTLFMIDEFSRLGYIPIIKDGLATLRSKGVCIALITQSLAQLRDIYGKDVTDSLLDLCSMKAILSASGETAELFSRMVGDSIQRMSNKGTSSKQFDIGQGASSGYSEQYQAKIRPAELANLGDDLILLEPTTGYVRVRKMPFYANKKAYL